MLELENLRGHLNQHFTFTDDKSEAQGSNGICWVGGAHRLIASVYSNYGPHLPSPARPQEQLKNQVFRLQTWPIFRWKTAPEVNVQKSHKLAGRMLRRF